MVRNGWFTMESARPGRCTSRAPSLSSFRSHAGQWPATTALGVWSAQGLPGSLPVPCLARARHHTRSSETGQFSLPGYRGRGRLLATDGHFGSWPGLESPPPLPRHPTSSPDSQTRVFGAVRAVLSAGAPASQGVRGQLGREPAGRADDVPGRPAPAHRHRTLRSGSSRTMPHLARSCGSPGAQWPPRARWRAVMVSCRSSRYARTGRTDAGETTSPQCPRTRRSRSRWAARLGRLLTMCSCGLPSSPWPAPHRHDQNHHRLRPSWAGG